jgi:hypothetical protein
VGPVPDPLLFFFPSSVIYRRKILRGLDSANELYRPSYPLLVGEVSANFCG